jgi:hypothetical protein
VLSDADESCKLVNVAATHATNPTRPQDQGFEPHANFWVNLRELGQRLAMLHVAPGPPPPWPFDGPTPISAAERKALMDLAQDHLKRHDLSKTPEVPPCPDYAGPCRAHGAASVVLSLAWAPGEVDAAAAAVRLDFAARRAESALMSFSEELAVYLQARADLHATPPYYACFASHVLRCELPARFHGVVEWLRAQIEVLRTNALAPQIPEHVGGPARLGLLKCAEGSLFSSAWTPDEIIDVLNDGDGGGPRERKDRLRKRRGPTRPSPSASEPQDD